MAFITSQVFFPERGERESLDFVTTEFPFPLAITYQRLQQELDGQEPIAAAWALRDAFECLLKFCACLALADFFQTAPDRDLAGKAAGLLCKPNGLSLGDWHTLLEFALRPLEPLARKNLLNDSGRSVPELFDVFFNVERAQRKPTSVNRSITGDQQSFIHWRNRVFGHGAFRYGAVDIDRDWYAAETMVWLPRLHEAYRALAPIFAGRRLIAITSGGEEVVWQGANSVLPSARHEHEPEGEPRPMLLTAPVGSNAPTLALTPFLSVQRCSVCLQPTAFFFDAHRYERGQERHRTSLLEYTRGHPDDCFNWSAVQKIASLVPPSFLWERTSWQSADILEGEEVVFRDFDHDYLRPDYVVDEIWRIVEEEDAVKGYVHLVGPAGIGKTYAVRGLEQEGLARAVPVLSYYIRPGVLTGLDPFCEELHEASRERLGVHTAGIQRRSSIMEQRSEVAAYLTELMRGNDLDRLVVVIDALDNLPDPEAGKMAIVNVLPNASELPEGCFIVLTTGPVLRPAVRAEVKRLLQSEGGCSPTSIELLPASPGNMQLVRTYLEGQLPIAFRAPEYVETVLQRSGGIFLYAHHLSHALAASVFPDVAILPLADEFYPAYLGQLRNRIGDEVFEAVYLPTLIFLAASFQPVTLEQLHRWGIPRDRLQVALFDLSDFLRVHKVPAWHDRLAPDGASRYEIAHDDFIRFLRIDDEHSEKLRRAHAQIANRALRSHRSQWNDIDVRDDADLYDLRFVGEHLLEAGLIDQHQALLRDDSYAFTCALAGSFASGVARYHIALQLFERALASVTNMIDQLDPAERGSRVELQALWKMERGNALRFVGRLDEAEASYNDAVETLRQLARTPANDDLLAPLALTLSSRSSIFVQLGRSREALVDIDEAVAILRQLIDERERVDLLRDLAKALSNAAAAWMRVNGPDPALKYYDESIKRYQQLAELQNPNEQNSELVAEFAQVMFNRMSALRDNGMLATQSSSLSQPLELFRHLVVDQKLEARAADLAKALEISGVVLLRAGLMEEAFAHFDEAVSIYQAQVAEVGRDELAAELASALMNRALAQRRPGLFDKALKDLNAAIADVQRLIKEQGRRDLYSLLAKAFANRGVTLDDLGQAKEAAASHEKALGIYRRLKNDGRDDLRADAAWAQANRGVALHKIRQHKKALEALNEAVADYRFLIKEHGRKDLALELASTMRNRSLIEEEAGLWKNVLTGHGDEFSVLESLGWEREQVQLGKDLAQALGNRGVALWNLDQHEDAIRSYTRAISIYRRLVKNLGQDDVALTLARYLTNRAKGLETLNRPNQASANYDEAIAIYKRLIQDDESSDLAVEFAWAYVNQAHIHVFFRRNTEAAENIAQATLLLNQFPIVQKDYDLRHAIPWTRALVRQSISSEKSRGWNLGNWSEFLARAVNRVSRRRINTG